MVAATSKKVLYGPDNQPLHTTRPAKGRFSRLQARYESAMTSDENRMHWRNIDFLSPDTSLTPEIRRVVRARARYEAANNTHCWRIAHTLATDIIGTGPRLKLRTGASRDVDQAIEALWRKWARLIRFAKKLGIIRQARCVDGEGLGLLVNNPRLAARNPVTLDIRPLECDYLASPDPGSRRKDEVDGVRVAGDDPIAYHILDEHPGGRLNMAALKGEWVDAERVIHTFRVERPGQRRGLSEMHAALHLFAMLRRYALAVLASAETAADFAAVIETTEAIEDDIAYEGQESDDETATVSRPYPFTTFQLAQRLVTCLPDGYKLNQVKAEQPTTSHGDFVKTVLREIFACVCMPYTVGAMDAEDSNFAAAKLDRLTYCRMVRCEQENEWNPICDDVFHEWVDEAAIAGALPPALPPIQTWTWDWMWDKPEDVDPEKTARANEIRLRSGQTTHMRLFADQGQDWEEELTTAAEAAGMPLQDYLLKIVDALMPSKARPGSPGAKPEESPDESELSDVAVAA